MKIILKPIFELLTGEYSLFNNLYYNYIAMLVIGGIAFYIAYDVVGRLYRDNFIHGDKIGSIIHWSVRLVVFIAIFYICSLIIWTTKFIYKYRMIIAILIILILAIITIVKFIQKKEENNERNIERRNKDTL